MDREGMGYNTRTVSRTLEYAYDDYSIAVLAEGLGKHDDAVKYMDRSGYWKNVWNPDQRDLFVDAEGDVHMTKFKGFPQPRNMEGEFEYQNTRTCSPTHEMHSCYFDTRKATYEGSPWLYSFYVPQDMAGLIKTIGGDDAFNERLDYFHSSGIAYMGNEQSFLTVFQFHYAGKPGKSSQWVHSYIPSQFNSSINGIPGNDDCAMGAFSSMAMMGFFPVAGQDVYLLTAPFFPEIRLRTRGERLAVIKRIGDPEGIYIQSAKLNGIEYTKSWISHEFFLSGGVLELVTGPKESSTWGVATKDRPPSYPT
jgi:putative alpha-1,2-mannosidase